MVRSSAHDWAKEYCRLDELPASVVDLMAISLRGDTMTAEQADTFIKATSDGNRTWQSKLLRFNNVNERLNEPNAGFGASQEGSPWNTYSVLTLRNFEKVMSAEPAEGYPFHQPDSTPLSPPPISTTNAGVWAEWATQITGYTQSGTAIQKIAQGRELTSDEIDTLRGDREAARRRTNTPGTYQGVRAIETFAAERATVRTGFEDGGRRFRLKMVELFPDVGDDPH